MSYGELGGNGSVQKAIWLAEPDVQATQLNRGPEAWQKLGEAQLSRRARAFIPRIEGTDLTFYGRDNTPAGLGNFRVRVNFQNEAEIREAAAAFQKAIGAKQVQVEFLLRVIKDTPGQIRFAWGAHADLNLGDDGASGNGTPGGQPRRPGLLARLWQRLLSMFR